MKDIFQSLAELIAQAAEAKFRESFTAQLRQLEEETRQKIAGIFQQAEKDAIKRAQVATVELVQRADCAGILVDVRVRGAK